MVSLMLKNMIMIIVIYYQSITISSGMRIEEHQSLILRRLRQAEMAIELRNFLSAEQIICNSGWMLKKMLTSLWRGWTDLRVECQGSSFVLHWDDKDLGAAKNLKRCPRDKEYDKYICVPCICIDPAKIFPDLPRAIKVFSLLPQRSAVEENKVVTGVRFLLDHRVIHLQIQQAKLLENGTVENHKYWNDVVKFERLRNSSFIGFQGLNDGGHYVKFSLDIRTIFLDEIVLPDQYVVTGVRLVKTGISGEHNGVKLQISGTKYNSNYELLNDTEQSFDFDQMRNTIPYKRNRREIDLKDCFDSHWAVTNEYIEDTNYYVQFRQSIDYKNNQSSVYIPLISTESAETDNNLPLQGVGISYKGSKGYGGFVTVKIFQHQPLIFSPTEPPHGIDPLIKRHRTIVQNVSCGKPDLSDKDGGGEVDFNNLFIPQYGQNGSDSIIHCSIYFIVISVLHILLLQ